MIQIPHKIVITFSEGFQKTLLYHFLWIQIFSTNHNMMIRINWSRTKIISSEPIVI